jgi:hypothetical protein
MEIVLLFANLNEVNLDVKYSIAFVSERAGASQIGTSMCNIRKGELEEAAAAAGG